MKNPPFLLLSTALVTGLSVLSSSAATVLAVADAELTESSPNGDGTAAPSGGGNGPTMNYRWSGDLVSPGPATSNRNDVIAIRFDLTGYNLAELQAVSLSLTSYRAGTQNPAKIYALSATATPTTGTYGAGDWVDGAISFDTMPGLIYDGLSTTHGLNFGQLTELGTLSSAALTKGQKVNFSSAALTSFINGQAGTSVTLVIAANAELTGQTRFATREATGLDADPVDTVPAGTYAPSLTFTVVPEPSALLLAGAGGLVLAFRRRVRESQPVS